MLRPTATIVSGALPAETLITHQVVVTWSGVPLDRPSTGGYGLGANQYKLAERLVRAINAGAVYFDPEVLTDYSGKTFVHAQTKVLARMVNADLRRLGF